MSPALEYLPVGCLGKLPFEREHLRVNLKYQTARRLDEWIQEGRHGAMLDAEGQAARAHEVAELRFLINEDGAPELLAGILRPSRDLENRPYPFALFTPVPRSLYGRHYSLLPFGLEPVWDGIEDLWRVLSTAVARHAFLEVISDASVPAPMPVGEAKSRYESAKVESAGRLFERADGASLTALDESWSDLMARLKKAPSKGAGPRLGFPVSRSLVHTGFDASFWLDLLNRQFFLKRFEPSLFLDSLAGESDRDVLLIFGGLAPEDYPGVVGGATARAEILRPATRGRGESQSPVPPSSVPSFSDLLARKFPTSV